MSHDEAAVFQKEHQFSLNARVLIISTPNYGYPNIEGEYAYVQELQRLDDEPWYYLHCGSGARGSLPERCLKDARLQ